MVFQLEIEVLLLETIEFVLEIEVVSLQESKLQWLSFFGLLMNSLFSVVFFFEILVDSFLQFLRTRQNCEFCFLCLDHRLKSYHRILETGILLPKPKTITSILSYRAFKLLNPPMQKLSLVSRAVAVLQELEYSRVNLLLTIDSIFTRLRNMSSIS